MGMNWDVVVLRQSMVDTGIGLLAGGALVGSLGLGSVVTTVESSENTGRSSSIKWI